MSKNSVEELVVYQRSVAAADAIFAMATRVAFNRDPELRQQMLSSSGRIQAHLQEGSGQSTRKHYAHFVSIARGSAKEMKGHLRRALGAKLIQQEEYDKFGKSTTRSRRC
ncbi:MAG TPA: four helix bundle protein [Vicinamibacterales bacterium]|nr:four helix bundle protein [Vicinamibacterales bacterium]